MNELDYLSKIVAVSALKEIVENQRTLIAYWRGQCQEKDAQIEKLQAVKTAARHLGEVVYHIVDDMSADDTLSIGDWESALREAYYQLAAAGEKASAK